MGRTSPANAITAIVVSLTSAALATALGFAVADQDRPAGRDYTALGGGFGSDYSGSGYQTPTYVPPTRTRSSSPSYPTYPYPTYPSSPSSSEPPTTTGAADTEESARAALEEQVSQDRATAETLIGQWVPQLSSKKPGMVVGGVAYGYVEVWEDFESLHAQYPDAVLLWSGDYPTYKNADYWVTVIPTGYGTGEAANAWCDARSIPSDGCYAKLLSHSGGAEGSSKPRG
ncbi:zinc ribbon domain-containing protein [Actinokineospora bangkokensis]|uniref:Uncharacterized protein n=1 Tax=Actinokineospora bangkokensis TaxID=1193682 RepID=A0A1Q9LCA5_9PSEU|nr:zinc ribbon domain-containing protein [Actinokineospora bangkokensis]OLR89658.1 hypothetical protein BJP25_04690 [Actinokineospora bangkokensis]